MMDMDVETAWQADLSDVAAGIIQRRALFAEMLDSWLDDYLNLRFQLHAIEAVLVDHFAGVLPECQTRQLRLVHDKMLKIYRAAYLARHHSPLVDEFFRMLDQINFDHAAAEEWLSNPIKCLQTPSWAPGFIEVIGMIDQRAKLGSLVSEEVPGDDDREQLMKKIIDENPTLKMKGEPDSILKRFRQERKEKGRPGIGEEDGLAMIRGIKGVQKKPRRRN